MTIERIESLIYGVEDIEAGARYFGDWGLEQVARGKRDAVFRTQENQTIVLRQEDAGAGSTLRETVWGVDSKDALDAIGAELSKDREVTTDSDGGLHSHDETGFAIGFRPCDRTPASVSLPEVNLNGAGPRLNRPVDPDRRARPIRVGHVVFRIPKAGAEAASAFYLERLKFRLSDRAKDTGDFMRCEGSTDHHNLFLAHREDRAEFNHAAFEVTDFDELMLGGKHMESSGWTATTRPGRHIMGSNLFWYFANPCGGATEYFADMDRMDDDWEPRVWDTSPGYAMWVMD